MPSDHKHPMALTATMVSETIRNVLILSFKVTLLFIVKNIEKKRAYHFTHLRLELKSYS